MFLTAPDLQSKTIRHGFFTRKGGKSSGLYDSLNCGPGSGDDIAVVTENRSRVARALGAKQTALCTCYQVHSATAVEISTPWAMREGPQADALVTNTPGIALGILTADCVPVLFADDQARVIGAAHAGWKGAYGGVVEATLAAMEKLGASRSRVTAAIGPAIAQGSYEVGPEFLERLITQATDNGRFFIPSAKPGHHMFDLKAYVRAALEKAGLASINLLANDTASEENDFFSFRRATLRQEPVYGRQISAIMLER